MKDLLHYLVVDLNADYDEAVDYIKDKYGD
jgi:hypothetical protein